MIRPQRLKPSTYGVALPGVELGKQIFNAMCVNETAVDFAEKDSPLDPWDSDAGLKSLVEPLRVLDVHVCG